MKPQGVYILRGTSVYLDRSKDRSTYRVNAKRKQVYRFMDDYVNEVEVGDLSNKEACLSSLSIETESFNVANVCAFDVTSGTVVGAYSYLAIYDYSQEAIETYLRSDHSQDDPRLLYLEQGDRAGLVYRFSYKNEIPRPFEAHQWTNVLSR